MSMTTNDESVIDEDTFSVRRTIRITAPIEKVWRAVTEPALISQWFGLATFAGATAGSLGTLTWPDRDPIPVRIEAINEPTMISYRWGNDDASGVTPEHLDEHATVFTFTLEPIAGGTQLTVVETGFENTSDPLANLDDHRGGWNGELDKLVVLLEASS